MTPADAQLIRSRDNALFKDLRRLAQEGTAYRKQGRIWLEGDHLCRAALAKGVVPQLAVFSETSWSQGIRTGSDRAAQVVVMPDALFASLSGLESPGGFGIVIPLSSPGTIQAQTPTVVLDRLQDAGNVGAILRSASAFGFRQVLAIKGTAGLWSPKVLRAGMGAHFSLALVDGVAIEDLQDFAIPLVTTSSHRGELLHQAKLPWPCAWVFGHEGRGVSDELSAMASASVRIVQPGGEESLNVASAAAICLHASAAGQAT